MRPFLAHPFDDDKLKEECGVFGVIEMWIEGRQMVEVLTPDFLGNKEARENF